MTDKSNRIFFLGMHVVLTKTELPRLRQLGYEVFNPPYLTDIYDQSANTNWDANQASTLPREVFEVLARTNFFYNRISPEAAEILNEYFGTVIVTINPDWLHEVLKVFHGRIIYRCYGQPWTIGEVLTSRGVIENIQDRDDFHIVPHALETTYEEFDWFAQRMRIVPYMLPWDIFDHRDTWASSERDPRRQVMVNIPNIRNPYYRNQYLHVKAHFGWEHYRIFGVQPNHVDDPQVVGTLSRDEFIASYKHCCGMLYPYHDERVCYLPPLEMMTIGGPVVYVQNSLLHRFFETAAGDGERVSPDSSPGLAGDLDDQRRRVEWLRQGDQKYVDDVIASQTPIALRYSPEHVWPIFDRTFRELISGDVTPVKPTILFDVTNNKTSKKSESLPAETRKRVYVLFHFPGHICQFKAGKYFSFEGIPRVVQKFVRAILLETDHEIVVTCYADQLFTVEGFFNASQSNGRIKMMVVDNERLRRGGTSRLGAARRSVSYWLRLCIRDARLARQALIDATQAFSREIYKTWPSTLCGPRWFQSIVKGVSWVIIHSVILADRAWDVLVMEKRPYVFARKVVKKLKSVAYRRLRVEKLVRSKVGRHIKTSYHTRRSMKLRREAIGRINCDPSASFVLIPHYYLFQEAVALDKSTVMYLPDYTPHFFPGVSFEPKKDKINNETGRQLAAKATAVFTNSEFSKGYLPETVLQVPEEKITCIPIPLLVGEHVETDREEKLKLNAKLGGKRFIFYPTANRPNKQIAFLLEIFAELMTKDPDLHLVLTCGLDDFPAARKAFERLDEASLARQREKAKADDRVAAEDKKSVRTQDSDRTQSQSIKPGQNENKRQDQVQDQEQDQIQGQLPRQVDDRDSFGGRESVRAGDGGDTRGRDLVHAQAHEPTGHKSVGRRNDKQAPRVHRRRSKRDRENGFGALPAKNNHDESKSQAKPTVAPPIPRFSDRVVFMQGATDAEIQWLYEHAVMMLFTSTMEGNFPPQVFESITYGTPVVATRLPLITEILKDESDRLLLCEPMAFDEYVSKARYALEHGDEIRKQQKIARDALLCHSSDERFNQSVGRFLVDRKLS